MLAVVCNVGEFRVYASTNYIDVAFGEIREVTWRVDHEPPVTQIWRNLQSGGAAIVGEEALQMARAIEGAASRIVVKSGQDVREFSTAGSTKAVSQLMEKCPNELLKSE